MDLWGFQKSIPHEFNTTNMGYFEKYQYLLSVFKYAPLIRFIKFF